MCQVQDRPRAVSHAARMNFIGAAGVALLVGIVYAGTLAQPFDFDDDGVTVSQAVVRGPFLNRVHRTVVTAVHECRMTGPFRPAFWAYTEFQAYFFSVDAFGWRVVRLAWAATSGALFFLLVVELGFGRKMAMLATILAMIAPMRSSIWYHICFGEGNAAPFVFASFLLARRATRSTHTWMDDSLAWLCMAIALWTKNVFMACIPALVIFRLWRDGCSLRESWAREWKGAGWLATTALLPLAHIAYLAIQPPLTDRYAMSEPSTARLLWMADVVRLSGGSDFVGLAVVLATIGCVCDSAARRQVFSPAHRNVAIAGISILACGMLVYVPIIQWRASGRYSIPAVWGLDLLLVLLWTGVMSLRSAVYRRVIWGSLGVGMAILLAANLAEQQKYIFHCRDLWNTMRTVAAGAPSATTIHISPGAMSDGEMFHMQAMLTAFGRYDLHLATLGDEEATRADGWRITRAGNQSENTLIVFDSAAGWRRHLPPRWGAKVFRHGIAVTDSQRSGPRVTSMDAASKTR